MHPRRVRAVFALLLTLPACGAPARGESAAPAGAREDSAFADPRPVVIRGYAGEAMEAFVTRDGRFLLFNNRNDPPDATELHYARAVDGLTFQYAGPLRGASSRALDAVPTLDRDGTLYFISTRSYGASQSTVYRGRFVDGAVTDTALVVGLPRRRGMVIFDVEVSADGTELYYAPGVFRGGPVPSAAELEIARRRGAAFEPWEGSAATLARVNTPGALEYAAAVSDDGLELFFTRASLGAAPAIYRATRASATAPFGTPARLAAVHGFAEAPALSPDGRSLYYHALVDGRFSLFRVTRRP